MVQFRPGERNIAGHAQRAPFLRLVRTHQPELPDLEPETREVIRIRTAAGIIRITQRVIPRDAKQRNRKIKRLKNEILLVFFMF